MTEIGNLACFGFRIHSTPGRSDSTTLSIFIGGQHVNQRDNRPYLISFVNALQKTTEWLKQRIDYLKYAREFGDRNLTELHNLLLHGPNDCFENELQWESAKFAHRFASWGETTNDFVAFLLPYQSRLFLTYQCLSRGQSDFKKLESVAGVEVTPYYLITVLDEAVATLREQ